MRILVIDDNEVFCRRLEELVQLRSYAVAWCTSGTHGLERALEEPFDLIITTPRLDDGSGIALSQRLRESLPETAVLVLGTRSEKSAVLLALRSLTSAEVRGEELAPGPLEPNQLLELIQRRAAAFVRAAE